MQNNSDFSWHQTYYFSKWKWIGNHHVLRLIFVANYVYWEKKILFASSNITRQLTSRDGGRALVLGICSPYIWYSNFLSANKFYKNSIITKMSINFLIHMKQACYKVRRLIRLKIIYIMAIPACLLLGRKKNSIYKHQI